MKAILAQMCVILTNVTHPLQTCRCGYFPSNAIFTQDKSPAVKKEQCSVTSENEENVTFKLNNFNQRIYTYIHMYKFDRCVYLVLLCKVKGYTCICVDWKAAVHIDHAFLLMSVSCSWSWTNELNMQRTAAIIFTHWMPALCDLPGSMNCFTGILSACRCKTVVWKTRPLATQRQY